MRSSRHHQYGTGHGFFGWPRSILLGASPSSNSFTVTRCGLYLRFAARFLNAVLITWFCSQPLKAQQDEILPGSNLEVFGIPKSANFTAEAVKHYTSPYGLPLAGWDPVKREVWIKGLAGSRQRCQTQGVAAIPLLPRTEKWLMRAQYVGGAMRKLLVCLMASLAFGEVALPQSNVLQPGNDSSLSLLRALLECDNASTAGNLLARYPNLVTPLLWDAVTNQAVRSYYDSSPARALELYDIAIAIARQLNNKTLIGRTYYKIGLTNSGIGRNEAAIQALLACRSLFDQAGLRRDVIYVLADLSSLYFSSQAYLQAEACAHEALAIATGPEARNVLPAAVPDQYGIASALSTLGSLSLRNGGHLKAIEYFRRSLALYEEIDHGTLQYGLFIADKLSALGGTYNLIGENGRALVFLTRALDISRKLPQVGVAAGVLNNLGVLYLDQEDYDRAADYLGQALTIYETESNHLEVARVSLNLAVTHQREGSLELALEDFTKSAAQSAAVSNIDLMIAAGEGLGAVHLAKGNYGLALKYLEQNLSLARKSNEVMRTAELLWRKAEVCNALQNFSDAVVLSKEALELARKLEQPKLVYLVTTTLGEAYSGLKDTRLAVKTLADAVDQMEAIRMNVAGEKQKRQLFLGTHIASYHDLVDLLAEDDKPFEALLYAEQAKARVLLDVLSGGKRPLTAVLTNAEREEQERLNTAITDANNEILNMQANRIPASSRIDGLAKRRDSARTRYAAFNDLMWSTHRELNSQHLTGRSLNGDNLRNLIQDESTALLEYVMTADRTWLFVLTRNTGTRPQLKFYQIQIRRADLVSAVERLHRLMEDRRPDYDLVARQLYDALVEPAASELHEKTTLCIVPDGLLWEVPFQALRTKTGRFLIEDYSVYYAQSLTILDQMAIGRGSGPKRPKLLALGNPSLKVAAGNLSDSHKPSEWEPLPEAESEVHTLGRIVGAGHSRIVVGADANERVFKSLAPGYSIIHFATHGVLDNRNPLFSYLVLARAEHQMDEDGLLEAREIMNMDLKADLAVLSACETARGKIGAGEGVIGMSWAFFAAGCRTTLVSQWKVNSASTSALMIKFYKYLQPTTRVKRTKAEALRLASLDLMKDERYRHPFYWAPFVLVGSN
jgi:CHAT domain-containing protein/tetratricopeptide (TPR) repeat protein